MDAYSGGWLLYFFCQQQMPGTVVSTRHTLKHNTAAFPASGRWVEKRMEERRGEMQKRTRQNKKTGYKNERESRRQTVERERETEGRRRKKEREKKQRLTQITSISTAETWAGFTIINREIRPHPPTHPPPPHPQFSIPFQKLGTTNWANPQ